MNTSYLRNERGVAMVFELALIAVVLGVVGFAVYQSVIHAKPKTATSSQSPSAQPNSKQNVANAAAAITATDAATDAAASTSAESIADQVSATDADVTTLGGSASAGSF